MDLSNNYVNDDTENPLLKRLQATSACLFWQDSIYLRLDREYQVLLSVLFHPAGITNGKKTSITMHTWGEERSDVAVTKRVEKKTRTHHFAASRKRGCSASPAIKKDVSF